MSYLKTPKNTSIGWWLKVAIIGLTVILLEAGLQALYYLNAGQFLFSRVAIPIFAWEPHARFALKPRATFEHKTNEFKSVYYTNSKGFRVSELQEDYAVDKRPSEYRIMLLGPSFAFGWGVKYEESFGYYLQGMLTERGFAKGKTIQVINAGIPSMPYANQLNWYKQEGRRYKPDLLIQFVYGSMEVPRDIDDNVVVDNGYLLTKSKGSMPRFTAQAKKSALVFYSWIIGTRILSALTGQRESNTILGAGRTLKTTSLFDSDRPEVKATTAAYHELRSVADADGTRLLVVYFPLSYCIHPEDIARWTHLGVGNAANQNKYNQAFCEYQRSTGLDCLNITADLLKEARANNKRLYYFVDIHWTPLGNMVAANSAASYLISSQGQESGHSRASTSRGIE